MSKLRHEQLPLEIYRLAEHGDKNARNKIIEYHMPLVKKMAKRVEKEGYEYEDLVQEGSIALIRAVEKFDWRKGFGFSTYAVWWLRHKYDAILKKKEVAKFNVDEWYKGLEMEATETVEQQHTEDEYEQAEMVKDIRKAVLDLPENQRVCIVLKYGMFGFPQVSVAHIARVLEKDKDSVKRALTEAEKGLKESSVAGWA